MQWLSPKSIIAKIVILFLLFMAVAVAAEFVLVMLLRYWYVVLMTLGVGGATYALIRSLRSRSNRW